MKQKTRTKKMRLITRSAPMSFMSLAPTFSQPEQTGQFRTAIEPQRTGRPEWGYLAQGGQAETMFGYQPAEHGPPFDRKTAAEAVQATLDPTWPDDSMHRSRRRFRLMHQNRGRERREDGAFAAEHSSAARFDLRGGTGVGNRQPQKEPHGVTPERLFHCGLRFLNTMNIPINMRVFRPATAKPRQMSARYCQARRVCGPFRPNHARSIWFQQRR